jgi:hypothetical protein
LYHRQWERLYIFSCILYREYKHDHNQIIFQYVVPTNERIAILQKAHNHVTAGHMGPEKTIQRILSKFYWPKWYDEVKQYVKAYHECKSVKAINYFPEAPLQPIITTRP